MIVLTERSTQLEHKVTYHVNSRWKRPVETSTRMRSFENLKSSTTFSRSTINLNPELVASSSSILIPLESSQLRSGPRLDLAGDFITRGIDFAVGVSGRDCMTSPSFPRAASHT